MIRKYTCVVILAYMPIIAACGSGGGDSAAPTTTSSEPAPPVVANAGPDQSVFIGTLVTLDGSKSTNAKGTGLSYSWTLKKPTGSNAVLSSPSTVNPTFTADVGGTYEATLAVSSPEETSTSDTVLVTASGTNPPPVANAGTNQNAFTGRTILLDGTNSSDANGDSLNFLWSVTGKPAGSLPTLLDAATAIATLIPDIPGNYSIRLVVNDGTSDSTPASVTITAADKPSPTANAGNDQFVLPNTSLVTLNGSSSGTNPPGETLIYEWTLNSASFPVSLNNANTAVATFTPPANTAGTVVAQLKVTEPNHPDASRNFGLDTVKITVGPLATIEVFRTADLTTPILTCNVSACPSTAVVVSNELRLDSSDSLVQPLTSSWRITSPSSGWSLNGSTIPIATGATATFIPNFAADTSDGTAYIIELTVTDSTGKSNVRSVTIRAKRNASASFTWSPLFPVQGNTVTLNPTIGASSNLTYQWEFVSRPASSSAVFSPNSTVRNPSFTADRDGSYSVKLTVTDTQTGSSDNSTNAITTNRRPTALITLPSPLSVCTNVVLNGTTSSDPDGFVQSYSWSLTPPTGSLSFLNSTISPTPTFRADKRALYSARLVVTDNRGLQSDPHTVNFTPVRNPTGQNIYDVNGLPGMSGLSYRNAIFEPKTLGPKCTDCHMAGIYDTTVHPDAITRAPGAPDLSNPVFTIERIKTRVTTVGHLGGVTNLIEPTLTQQITAIRQFLDSTLANCP